MSRGNQREKAREKNQAATAGKVCSSLSNNVSTSVQADTDHRARRPPYVRSYTSHNDQSPPNNMQPGRLLDHLESTKGFSLRSIKYLVLDEADRLLDLDFGPVLDKILKV